MTAPPITTMQQAFWGACEQMLMTHTNPWELDEALTDWGYGIGPCAAQDLAGLERVLTGRNGVHPTPILARMVSEGRLGRGFGWGFYRYPGGGGAVIDPLIDDLIREEAWFAKHPRDELEGAALVRRLHDMIGDMIRGDPGAAVAQVAFPAHRLAEV